MYEDARADLLSSLQEYDSHVDVFPKQGVSAFVNDSSSGESDHEHNTESSEYEPSMCVRSRSDNAVAISWVLIVCVGSVCSNFMSCGNGRLLFMH